MIIPHWSCYYKIPRSFLYYSENTLCLLPSSSLPHEYPLRIIPRTYWVFVHPQLFVCFIKYSEIPFDLLKILSNLLLWNFLFASIMINPISLVILLASIVIIIWVRWFNMLRMLAILNQILEFILPAQTPFLNMSWVSTNQVAIDCNPLCLFGYPSMIRVSASNPLFWKS